MNRALVFFLLVSTFCAYGQGSTKPADTTQTRKLKFLPTGVRLGTDLAGIIKSNIVDDFSAWEITTDIDFHRYLVVADFGYSASGFHANGAEYNNDGNYWRLGIDANFLTRDKDRNAFFLGLHYGRSSYNESMTIVSEDPLFGTLTDNFSNTGLQANWLELNGGLKVKIWKWMWLGYTARYKFSLKSDESKEMLTHEVPGYGRTNNPATWGFNYYVFIRLPFRKASSILPPLN